ncbi:MAG: hypothetical protein WCS94_11790 [Verrucomicrobiota bacterium]
MEKPHLSKYTHSFGIALAVTSVANGLLVMAKEKNPAVLAAMKSLTGHHWITHSVIVVTLFLVLGWGLSKIQGGTGVKLHQDNLIRLLAGGVFLGALLIVGFYLLAD